MAIRVLIADDEPMIRAAFADLIDLDPDLELVAIAADAQEAGTMSAQFQPDVAVVDVRMPGGGGPAAAEEIRRVSPNTRILAFSAATDRQTVIEMLDVGAVGYSHKGSMPGELLAAIRQAAEGTATLSPDVASGLAPELIGRLQNERMNREAKEERRELVEHALDGDALRIVYQPIVKLQDHSLVGVECLSRFAMSPAHSPDWWFAEAAEVGLLEELESHAIQKALEPAHDLGDVSMALNVSPSMLLSGELDTSIKKEHRSRAILELTEHAPVGDYDSMAARCATWRSWGTRIAIDDVGAGFASMRHILRLQAEVIKLDNTLTQGVETDASLQALTASFVTFADRTGAMVVAEGIENETQAEELERLGVQFGQGYHLGRPEPIEVLARSL